jgi:hypothetical protein
MAMRSQCHPRGLRPARAGRRAALGGAASAGAAASATTAAETATARAQFSGHLVLDEAPDFVAPGASSGESLSRI